jgi:CPA2 family monovalent cation:H+ antiporter-2
LLTAAVLFVIIGTGVLAAVAGLSMALGAFVAGLLLAETEYRKAVEAIVEPFKGLLLGIFFFTVGMSIDVREVAREPLAILALVFGLIALKAAIIMALSRVFKQPWSVAIETGFLLGPGGEFAFVAVELATGLGLIAPALSSFVLAATSLTMVFIPPLSAAARHINSRIGPPKEIDPELKALPQEQHKHAIVVGHGRVGKVVTSFLRQHKVPYIATDSSAASVTEDRKSGDEVYFGDARHAAFMKACGIMEAAAVIVTMGSQSTVDAIVLGVRQLRPDVLIVARAKDTEHARRLYAIGVTDAVPETVEASLQISEAALVGLGIPMGFVIASIHDKRDAFRSELREAATEVAREPEDRA